MGTALAIAGMGLGLVGGIQQAQGAKAQAQAQSQSYYYQSQIADNNAQMAQRNAQWTGEAGDIQSTAEGLKTGAEVASMKAKQAASGIDVNTGSAVTAREAADRIGMINAMTIKSNKAREAWGYTVDKSNEELQSSLYKRAGISATKAGAISAGSTLLSSAGMFAGQLSKWHTAGGGFGGGNNNINIVTDALPGDMVA